MTTKRLNWILVIFAFALAGCSSDAPLGPTSVERVEVVGPSELVVGYDGVLSAEVVNRRGQVMRGQPVVWASLNIEANRARSRYAHRYVPSDLVGYDLNRAEPVNGGRRAEVVRRHYVDCVREGGGEGVIVTL